jgi:hypothetical protein
VAEQRAFHEALLTSGKLQDLWDMGEEYFARGIEQRLKEICAARSVDAARLSAQAHAFAGALFSMLSWWLRSSSGLSAEEMDHLFHSMVWSASGMPLATASQQAKTIKRFIHI